MNTVLPVSIYAESTPNPVSMKFVLNTLLAGAEGESLEYRNKEQALSSPLAEKLFALPFTRGVFISSNFITLTQDGSLDWYEIIPEVKEIIKTHIDAKLPVFTGSAKQVPDPVSVTAPGNDTEEKIISILNEYIRPAVEGDGGAIHFRSFDNGVVTVMLKGACSGCPSSAVTLKNGIENLLTRMVPGVQKVIAENDIL